MLMIFLGSEDYFKHTTAGGFDFHLEEGKNCGPECTKLLWNATGSYSTNLFTERAVNIIDAHDASDPMFMYLAYQGTEDDPPPLLLNSLQAYTRRSKHQCLTGVSTMTPSKT